MLCDFCHLQQEPYKLELFALYWVALWSLSIVVWVWQFYCTMRTSWSRMSWCRMSWCISAAGARWEAYWCSRVAAWCTVHSELLHGAQWGAYWCLVHPGEALHGKPSHSILHCRICSPRAKISTPLRLNGNQISIFKLLQPSFWYAMQCAFVHNQQWHLVNIHKNICFQ